VSEDTRPVGSLLTCDQGEWEGSGTVTFQWLVDGEPVGDTGTTNPRRFRCRETHVGRTIACAVTKTNQHGATTVETNPIVVVPSGRDADPEVAR
jgi:hypothetical protein